MDDLIKKTHTNTRTHGAAPRVQGPSKDAQVHKIAMWGRSFLIAD